MGMNVVVLTGNLTKDLEVKKTQSGKSVVKFTLATGNSFDKDKTDFISCVAWSKTAETMGKYLKKGSKIGIHGRLQTGNYEKDGVKVYTTDVIVANFEFLDSKNSNNSQKDDDPTKSKDYLKEKKEKSEEIDDEFPF